MTNIKVKDAVHYVLGGHITFSCNFRRDGDYTVRSSMSDGLTIENKDANIERKRVSRDEILNLIRQDDSGSWPDWGRFVYYWIGQAERQERAEKELRNR